MKRLTILVTGESNSGKSTIAYEIRNALKQVGLDAFIREPYEVHPAGWEFDQKARLEKLVKKGMHITIEVSQVPRA